MNASTTKSRPWTGWQQRIVVFSIVLALTQHNVIYYIGSWGPSWEEPLRTALSLRVSSSCCTFLVSSYKASFFLAFSQSLSHRFKPKLQQLQTSGSLADRKLISTELTEKMPLLIELLNNEMDNAKEIFDQQEVILLPLMSVQFVTNYLVLRREFEGLGRR